MEIDRILMDVMVLVALSFLALFFLFPGEIHLGAAVASLILAGVFHRRSARTTRRSDDLP